MVSSANKYFVFGLGSAFIILPLLFYWIYSTEYKKTVATYSSAVTITDEEIVARAEKMGMVFLKSLPSGGGMNEDELISKLSNEAIISRGMELGLVPATEIVPPEEAVVIWKNIDAPDEPSADGTQGNEIDYSEADAIVSEVSGTEAAGTEAVGAGESTVIRVDIPIGVSSTTISQILEKAGVVNDADRLTSYFTEKEMSRQLLQGTYEFRQGESFDEILKMLSTHDETEQ